MPTPLPDRTPSVTELFRDAVPQGSACLWPADLDPAVPLRTPQRPSFLGRMKMSIFFLLRGGCADAPPPPPVADVAAPELVPAPSRSSAWCSGGLPALAASEVPSDRLVVAGGGDADAAASGDGACPSSERKDDLRPRPGAGDPGSGEPKRLEATEEDRDERRGWILRGLKSSRPGEETRLIAGASRALLVRGTAVGPEGVDCVFADDG